MSCNLISAPTLYPEGLATRMKQFLWVLPAYSALLMVCWWGHVFPEVQELWTSVSGMLTVDKQQGWFLWPSQYRGDFSLACAI